jgi:threonine dehydrogenase-like Zn-dependent dehydrogenase
LCASYETLGLHRDGGLAEFVRVPAKTVLPVPDAVTDDDAALAQPLAVAVHAVRRSRIRPDASLVVIGVGGIGAFIVAAAASYGVVDITAVDVDSRRLATAISLGASSTIDASGADLVDAIRSRYSDGPDVIIEASGAPGAPAAAVSAIRRGGRIVLVGLQTARRETDLFSISVKEVELVGTLAHVCDEDLPGALEALGRRALAGIVVERTLSLDELVPAGIVHLAERTATGKYLVDPTR